MSALCKGNVLLEQLRLLANIGADNENDGQTRLALSDTDKDGRDKLVQWMHELNLDVRVDMIGNIFGTMKGLCSEKPIMIGSHIDTVINAGALDGCYGVLSGLAVVRSLRAMDIVPNRDLIVAAFTNEEGVRYQPDKLGSLVYSGGLDINDALRKIGTDGTVLGDELSRIGYAGEMRPGEILPEEYLELHIEQRPILEKEGLRIGAVKNLQGISWQEIKVEGVANHGGTTPMSMRHDASYVAARIISHIRTLTKNGTTLAAAGYIKLEPGAVNIIPREARFTVDLRDPDEDILVAAENNLNEFIKFIAEQEGVKITAVPLSRSKPVIFDADLVNDIVAKIEEMKISYKVMTSGAGHDAQMMACVSRAAMIFVPSRAGIRLCPLIT